MLIKVNSVSKSYGTTLALNNLSFNVEEGSICGIIGPNGSGKTTFLSILTGLLDSTSGEIIIENNKSIGALIEGPSFYDHLTVKQNLYLISHLRNIATPTINNTLDIVNLRSQAEKNTKICL